MNGPSPALLTRLAPTPSGYLHAGNLFNFLYNWLWARSNGGRVLLRIDDMDASRMRPEYVAHIFQTLHYFGLHADLGPKTPENLPRDWSQHRRMPLYEQQLQVLAEQKLVYACACSRKDLAAHTIYPGHCREKGLPLDTPGTAGRLRVPDEARVTLHDRMLGRVEQALAPIAGDFVIRRRDGLPAYAMCSVADDLHFGVTHVARGEDLLPSTLCQLFLAEQLGEKQFREIRFLHHPLLADEQGRKLSKTAGDGRLPDRQLFTRTPEAWFGQFAYWCGWLQEERPVPMAELLEMASTCSFLRP